MLLLAVDLVEVLFDYQPDDWYVIDDLPPPQAPEELDGDQARLLAALARQALAEVPIEAPLARQVRSALRVLDRR